MIKQKVLLVILDGWGIGSRDLSNPIRTTKTPALDFIKINFPLTALQASGIAVGLPWNEEGNSEVGHLTLGAGKVLYQYYPRIIFSIKNGEFSKNPVFTNAFDHAKKNQSAVQIIGLLSDGNVHASLEPMLKLIELAEQYHDIPVRLHLFSDGRDTPPRYAEKLFAILQAKIKTSGGNIKIATVTGRFYGLDKENRWERTAKTYKALTEGKGESAANTEEAFKKLYAKNLNDEFLPPTGIASGNHDHFAIAENDALIFTDYREDGIRQIASSFIDKNFAEFPHSAYSNLYIATMTLYRNDFKNPVAFPPENINMPISKVLSMARLKQLKIAEAQKYAHVTYFFNGLIETPFPEEFRIIIPSEGGYDPLKHPAYQSNTVTNYILQALEENIYDFILANYAAPDLVAHTGNFEAAQKTIEAIDKEMGLLTKAVIEKRSGITMLITGDHGNIERMRDPLSAAAETKHDLSPVPFYLVNSSAHRTRNIADIETFEYETGGTLADVAPTILEIMGLPKPKEMTGISLIPILR